MPSRMPTKNASLRKLLRKEQLNSRRRGNHANNNQNNNNQSRQKSVGTVSPRGVKALTSSLKLSTEDVVSPIMTIDSQQNSYKGFYFHKKTGPVLAIENLSDSSYQTLSELVSDTNILAQELNASNDGGQAPPPPTEIYLAPDERLSEQARQTLLQNTLTTLNLGQVSQGKEYTRELFNGYVKFKLVDTPEFIEPQHQVMRPLELVREMGERDQYRPGHQLYNSVIKTLGNYIDTVNLKQDELVKKSKSKPLSPDDFKKANDEVQAKLKNLNDALNQYLNEGVSLKIPKTLLNKKYRAIKKLQKQLVAANKDDINEVLEVTRQNYWLRTFNPLNANTAAQGVRLGKGAQGEVFSKIFDVSDRPDLPDSFEAATKFSAAYANDEAFSAGIPRDNPGEAKRAVATYEMSRLLGLDVIPPTVFVLGTNPRTKRQELGYAIQKVSGTDAQIDERTHTYTKEEITQSGYLNDPKIDIQGNEKRVWNEDGILKEAYRFITRPVQVPSMDTNAQFQKDLANLQILDNVIGHADRHLGNVRIELAENNTIRVKGIDNDDTFGSRWAPKNPHADLRDKQGSKTPGMPPTIDVHAAVSILKVTPNDLEPLRTKLTDAEYQATKTRLENVQKTIRQRITDKQLAIMPGQTLSEADKAFLATAAELPNASSLSQLPQWGSVSVYQAYMPVPVTSNKPPITNSYIGEIIALAQSPDPSLAPSQSRGFASWPNNA
ncbi:hypothetical protein [Halomicronema sp. CCY15110]|uniref:hypothetical protein n=1 Tax=Halomicronema sp. CCY15110 TaxID=2767773 RepID=UPI0019509EF9|nr:hypothetical protein [Halomicronema sp. CCY15110]